MTEVEVADQLRAFEHEHDLFQIMVDGWSPWRTLRFRISNMMRGVPIASMNPGRASSRMLRAIHGTVVLFLTLVIGRTRAGIIKSFASALREQDGSRCRDVYFESLLDSGVDCFKIEVVDSCAFDLNRKLALRPADLSADVFQFWGRVLGTLLPRRELDSRLSSLQNELASKLGVILTAKSMRRVVSSTYWQIKIYQLLLRRLRVRFAIVADTSEYAFSVACRRERVRFIELQHGIFGRGHPDMLPADVPGGAAELMLPECLAVFGDFWRARMTGTAFDRVRVVSVGSSQIERARQLRRQRVVTGSLCIVVTSQGIDTKRLSEWTRAMIAAAPQGQRFEVIVKLHPAYDSVAGAYASVMHLPNVRLIQGAQAPSVYELLADADMHVSISSACHFDALGIGVPTVVVPLITHETVLELVDGACAHLAKEPGDVWVILNSHSEAMRSEEFYSPGFVANIQALIG